MASCNRRSFCRETAERLDERWVNEKGARALRTPERRASADYLRMREPDLAMETVTALGPLTVRDFSRPPPG
jgi:hypothetical protein